MLLGKKFTILLTALLASAGPLTDPATANVYTKCVAPNTVALTFDDGPWIYECIRHTLQSIKLIAPSRKELSDWLTNNGVKATFFVNGNNYGCIYNASIVASLQHTFQAGHQICSHTWSHPHLTKLNKTQIATEIVKLDTALEKVLGIKTPWLRPPYGEYNDLVRQTAYENNKNLVTWNFDSLDSDGATAAQSQGYYDSQIDEHPANLIVLNHETEASTVREVIPYAVPALKAAGYKFVTVAECLGGQAYSSEGSFSIRDNTWKC
ncbi:carbohydrate esterase family 4 protein [Mycena metata]|uniref:Carbohydrate esterase family 4 protein n=1 Tax=Mycena metata TaxID=1033252 RepID=A0AAD7IPC6_9AGAR|nr:carbohydrate esterase family 4 protein [Mycena metata]